MVQDPKIQHFLPLGFGFLITVFYLLVFPPCVVAVPPASNVTVDRNFLAYYYQHPDASRFEQIFKMINLNDWKKSGSSVGFFAGILNTDPVLVGQFVSLVQQAKLNEDGRKAAMMALWFCNSTQCKRSLEKNPFAVEESLLQETVQYAPVEFSSFRIRRPSDLDMLWGWFTATGQTPPVERILSLIVTAEKLKKQEIATANNSSLTQKEKAINDSAIWSFISQAANHTPVYGVLTKCSKQEAVCRGLLETVDKKRTTSKKNSP